MHNIEKSGFHKGQYVGYGRLSGVWRISGGTGNWKAVCQTNRHAGVGVVYARTLKELSGMLSSS